MRQRIATAILATTLLLSAGSSAKLKKLSATERDHFDALKVYMDKKQVKAFFKNKTEEDRNNWLKDMGLWDRYYQYDKDVRDLIAQGAVAPGWTLDQVYMAWGAPHQRRRLSLPNVSRSEVIVYKLEVTPEGSVLVWEEGSSATHGAIDRYRYELVIHVDKVAEMIKKDGWD